MSDTYSIQIDRELDKQLDGQMDKETARQIDRMIDTQKARDRDTCQFTNCKTEMFCSLNNLSKEIHLSFTKASQNNITIAESCMYPKSFIA